MSETDLAEVWARSLEELATMQIEPHQRAWLKLTRPLGLVENTALIATPNEFVKEQLETRLRALITHALSRELGRSIQLAVTVDPTAITAATAFPPAPADPGPAAGQPGIGDGHGGMPGTIGSPMGGPMSGRVPRAADPLDDSSSLGGGTPSLGSTGSLDRTGLDRTGDPRSVPGNGQLRPGDPHSALPGRPDAASGGAPLGGPFDSLAGRRSTRPGRHCPGRPGLPRPGSIPSTPSRPS